jgi:uncharacterized protein HemX
MEKGMGRNRFQFSLRTLLLVTLALALLLVPVTWVSREREQMIRARYAILEAREEALRSVVLEEQRRLNQGHTGVIEKDAEVMQRLDRENKSLRQQVNELRREVEQLRTSLKPLGTAER